MAERLSMTAHRSISLMTAVFLCLACAFAARAQALDNGIDPSNLGKGDWVYSVHAATNKLGGTVPGVTSLPSLLSYFKNLGLQFIVVKVGTGSTNFNSAYFNSDLLASAHAAGLKVFGYTRSYGTDIPGEIALASRVYDLGADGFVIDAEAEWESSHLGANGPALALQLCQGIKAKYPSKFLAHAPFPVITHHPTFPYKEFGLYCDAVMPQAYWKRIGTLEGQPLTPERMVARMNLEWMNWQNSLTGVYTNAVKPIAPIAQGWNPSPARITAGSEIIRFVNALEAVPNPASRGGYKGVSFWRSDLHTTDIWPAISFVRIGNPLSFAPPLVTAANRTAVLAAASSPSQTHSNAPATSPPDFGPQTNRLFQFAPAESNVFQIGSTALASSTRIILDNSSAQFSGTWTLSSTAVSRYGPDYRFIRTVAGAPTGIASFNPNLPVPGYYSIYLWFSHGSNRPTNAPVTLIYPGGATNLLVDQTADGGRWRLLASHMELPSGSATFLQIANNVGYPGKVVMADAVQFVLESPQEASARIEMPASRHTPFFLSPLSLPSWPRNGQDPSRNVE